MPAIALAHNDALHLTHTVYQLFDQLMDAVQGETQPKHRVLAPNSQPVYFGETEADDDDDEIPDDDDAQQGTQPKGPTQPV
jgi:hypothetical protein